MDIIQQLNERPKASAVLKNPVHLLATGFGSGLSSIAPGTVGSLTAVVIYQLALLHISGFWQLVIVFFAFIAGIFICAKTASDWGAHDHKAIVWDEWAAQWLVLALLPGDFFAVVAGFLLFRLFDVWKPWPISWVDRNIHGGFGIMLDDVIAGVFAIAVFWSGYFVISRWLG